MKYKWKDNVRIKSKKELECISEVTDDMLKNGGAIMTIACLVEDADAYIMKQDGDFHYLWTDEMIEGLVEEELSLDKAGLETDFEYEGLAYTLPEGYIFKDENGNVINATKIVLEKKKKEYPKTYEECCEVLGIEEDLRFVYENIDGNHINPACISNYRIRNLNLYRNLEKLRICRDAYWKIAGEEMGLGKPWKPDWTTHDVKYCLINSGNKIVQSCECKVKRTFAFPNKEMRDAFYENFKSEIEECKEFL